MQNKPLTEAQQKHLAALIAERQRIEAEIGRFTSYLAEEHNAPASDGWTRIDPILGLVCEVPDDKSRS